MALLASRRFENEILVDHVPAHNLASDEDQSTVHHHLAPEHHVRPDRWTQKQIMGKENKSEGSIVVEKMKHD